MFSKANLISTLVTAIWGLGGGFLLWGIVADPLLQDHLMTQGMMKDPIDMVHLALGCIIQGFGFSSIYRKYGATNYGVNSGLGMGILAAIMVGLGEGLIDFATANLLDIQGTLVNFVVYLVFFGITGLLAGLVYKKLG
ncbi:MAG: hypothetical protein HKN48_08340 [Flavobacteriaceae bacterium]|nr:hypothetical protein [Flavobacteriaceae bacterium]